MDINKENLAESGIKVGQTFSVDHGAVEPDLKNKIERCNQLNAEIKDMEKHIHELSSQIIKLKEREDTTCPIFITIDNDCVGISGNYSASIIRGLQHIIQDFRYGIASRKLQLNGLLK